MSSELTKRTASERDDSNGVEESSAKRARTDGGLHVPPGLGGGGGGVETTSLVLAEEKKQELIESAVLNGEKRTSKLEAPTMLLSGHAAAVHCVRFSPDGQHLASGSFDKDIFLWNTYGECKNYGVLKGHKGAVLDLTWSRDGDQIFSCGADKGVYAWDADTLTMQRRLKSHTNFVNAISVSRKGDAFLVSASDDGAVMSWDMRSRKAVEVFRTEYQILTVALSDDSTYIFSAGIDPDIQVWDRRNQKVVFTMPGHMDSVTGMELSPTGSYLLTNSMDQTVRQWDVRAYVKDTNQRMLRVFQGARHDFQKNLLRCSWSPDESRVSAGSADRLVNIWDTLSMRLLYRLPGHLGCVNDVDFHPLEPIVASGSSDKQIYLGEIA